MCMKVFALHRCRTPANGGCDGYFAEYLEDQGCNRMMHGGLPQLDCRMVWAGFEDERSARVNHRDSYAKRARLCPECRHAAQIAHVEAQAALERSGAFSERMKALVADLTRRAELGHTEFLLRVYHELWDAARCLVAGLSARTDAAWDAIEEALRVHFDGCGGGDGSGIATAPARILVAALREAKRGLAGHVRTSVKELAVALVGPNESWDDDLELGGYIDEDWRRQRQAAVEASRQRAREEEEREEERHGLQRH